jgi:hypothetical protein
LETVPDTVPPDTVPPLTPFPPRFRAKRR